MSDASVRVIDGRAVVQVGGSELLAPIAKQATDAAASAEKNAQAAEMAAQASIAAGRYYPTRAAGEAGSNLGQLFSSGDGAGNVIYYEKTNSGSYEIGRAVTPATLAGSDGSKQVGYKAAAHATVRTVEDALGDRVSLASYILATEGQDQTAAFARAFSDLDTVGGKGASVYLPGKFGAYNISEKILMPTRTKVIGDGSRATIINALHNGEMFGFDSVTNCSLERLRLGMGSGAAMVAIDIKSLSNTMRDSVFEDLEIAGAGVVGQIGIRAFATSGHIVTENTFTRIVLKEIDRPIIDADTEGNFWTQITVDQFGYAANAAIDARGLANFYLGIRVAGAPAAGSIGYRQFGLRNHATIITDIGNAARALDLSQGSGNIVLVHRPLQDSPFIQTPLGNIGRTNRVIEGSRQYARGSLPAAGVNVSLDGFGDNSQISSIGGDDSGLQFTVVAGGPGGIIANAPGHHPKITYSFADGLWPFDNAILTVRCDDGDQTGMPIRNKVVAATGWTCEPDFQPVAGQSYVFQVTVR